MGIGKENSKLAEKRKALEGCIKTLLVIEGGFRESIVHGKTGLLVNEPYLENFVEVVKDFGAHAFDPKVCMERAGDFSEEKFIEKIRGIALRE